MVFSLSDEYLLEGASYWTDTITGAHKPRTRICRLIKDKVDLEPNLRTILRILNLAGKLFFFYRSKIEQNKNIIF